MKWPRPRTVVLHGRQGLATENGAWIGGYPQGQGGKILAWFSEEVSSDCADWLKLRKDPKRLIASLELLATLAAVKIWTPVGTREAKAKCWIRGKADNLGNAYALRDIKVDVNKIPPHRLGDGVI